MICMRTRGAIWVDGSMKKMHLFLHSHRFSGTQHIPSVESNESKPQFTTTETFFVGGTLIIHVCSTDILCCQVECLYHSPRWFLYVDFTCRHMIWTFIFIGEAAACDFFLNCVVAFLISDCNSIFLQWTWTTIENLNDIVYKNRNIADNLKK